LYEKELWEKKYKKIIRVISKFFHSQEFYEIARNTPGAFTRVKIMPLPKLVLSLINLVSRSTSVELHRFFTRILKMSKSITKQAFSYARGFLSHKVFIKMNDLLVDCYYEEDYKTTKGFILLAADGSGIELPTSQELINDFGCASNQLGKTNRPTGNSSILFDLNNGIIINGILEKYNYCEKKMLLSHLEKIQELPNLVGKRLLIILDRCYPSMELFCKLEELGINFIMRSKKTYIKETQIAGQCKNYDKRRKIKIKNSWVSKKPHLKEYQKENKGIINLRFISHNVKGEQNSVFITNLGEETFNREEIAGLYKRRWEIETHFRHEKETCEFENFACKTTIRLYQEYHCKIYTMNHTSLLIEEAQKKLDEKVESGLIQSKYQLKINKNIAFGLVKDSLPHLLFMDKSGDFADSLTEEMVRHRIPVKKNRVFERKMHFRKRKHNVVYRRAL